MFAEFWRARQIFCWWSCFTNVFHIYSLKRCDCLVKRHFPISCEYWLFILCLLPCLPPEKKAKKSDCGEWQWSVCVPTNGDCGLGTREGTRTGAECKQTTKTQKCKIPCNWKKQFGGKHHTFKGLFFFFLLKYDEERLYFLLSSADKVPPNFKSVQLNYLRHRGQLPQSKAAPPAENPDNLMS